MAGNDEPGQAAARPKARELGSPAEVEFVGGPAQLIELLGHADAVMCCAELHAGNARMFGAAQFAAMRP